MAIDPREIQLDEAQRRQLAELAEKTGKPWSELLGDAMHRIALENTEAVERLRKILVGLSHDANDVPSDELDELVEEAIGHARHGKG